MKIIVILIGSTANGQKGLKNTSFTQLKLWDYKKKNEWDQMFFFRPDETLTVHWIRLHFDFSQISFDA